MREVPSGATPATFTAAQPPKRRAGKMQRHTLHILTALASSSNRLSVAAMFIRGLVAARSCYMLLQLVSELRGMCCCAASDSKYAAHAGILDAAKVS